MIFEELRNLGIKELRVSIDRIPSNSKYLNSQFLNYDHLQF